MSLFGDNEEELEEGFKVKVIYTDGSVETFDNVDDCSTADGGSIVIQLVHNKVVTISPFAYKKVVEDRVYED